jgi:hypothetical protein
MSRFLRQICSALKREIRGDPIVLVLVVVLVLDGGGLVVIDSSSVFLPAVEIVG